MSYPHWLDILHRYSKLSKDCIVNNESGQDMSKSDWCSEGTKIRVKWNLEWTSFDFLIHGCK